MGPQWLVYLYRDFAYKIFYSYLQWKERAGVYQSPKLLLFLNISNVYYLEADIINVCVLCQVEQDFFSVFQSFFFNCMRIILPYSVIIVIELLSYNGLSKI